MKNSFGCLVTILQSMDSFHSMVVTAIGPAVDATLPRTGGDGVSVIVDGSWGITGG